MASALLGVLSFTLFVLVLVVSFLLFMPFAVGKFLVPLLPVRRAMTQMMEAVGRGPWRLGNRLAFLLTLGRSRNIVVEGVVTRDRSWLLLGNHSSWVDIPLLFDVLGKQMAFPRFFLKEELRWMPIIGFASWALDMPFVRRHTRAEVAANPMIARDDLEATRRACARFHDHPVTLVNFAEGTRFTPAKHAAQGSPFQYLLRPKAGGLAFALDAMGDHFAGVIDVTFAYRATRRGPLWSFLCGDQRGMRIYVTVRPLPMALLVHHHEDNVGRRGRCQAWINALWEEKDARIARFLAEDAKRGV